MKKVETHYFAIQYQKDLEDFVQKSLKIFEKRLVLLQSLFKDQINNMNQVRCAIFSIRKDFVEHIKRITSGQTPPNWASGCFYNNEIQIFVNQDDKAILFKRQSTLIHEFAHLCINKLIYNAFNLERVRWLDESFAAYVDGHLESVSKKELKDYCEQLKPFKNNFDMNELDDIKKVKTENYNGYNMFDIIGKYIFENNLQGTYLELLTTDAKQIRAIGQSILSTAIDYVESL